MNAKQPHILYLGQYDLTHLDSAPKVRTAALYRALTQIAQVDFISAYRAQRRPQLWKYLLAGHLKEVDAIYLEAATSTSMEVDFLLLFLARLLKKPIGIFIRDAHPLFGMIKRNSIKNRLLILSWHISIWLYQRLASVLYFPSERFSKLFAKQEHKACILPPGGNKLPFIPLNPQSRTLLYVGGLGAIYSGIFELFAALNDLYQTEPKLKLICVCRPKELDFIQDWLNAPWLDVRHLESAEIPALRSEVLAAVVPLGPGAYADLALPVKLFDYLALGRPILASNHLSIREFVQHHQVGLISESQHEDFKQALEHLFTNPQEAKNWAQNAYETIHQEHSWEHRAQTILQTLLPQHKTNTNSGTTHAKN